MIRKSLRFLLLIQFSLLIACASQPENTDEDIMSGEDVAAAEADSQPNPNSSSTDEAMDEFATDSAAADSEDLTVEPSEQVQTESPPAAPQNNEEFADFEDDKGSEESSTPQKEAVVESSAPTENRSGGAVQILNIGYLANNHGGSIVIETSGTPELTKRFVPDTNQFIIEVAQANLPDRLKRPYVMKDFPGEFGAINAYQNGPGEPARIVVQLKGSRGEEPILQQEGSQILVMPKSGQNGDNQVADSSKNGMAARREKALSAATFDDFLTGEQRFYGSELSIQTKNADVRDVLDFIADQSGVNMIISDDVSGKISIKLRKVPWDQALVTVMRAKKLGYVRQGEVLRISTLAELKSESDASRQILESQKALEPLKIKIIPINYANLDDLVLNLTKLVTKQRGSVVQDKASSSIILTDTQDVLDRLSALIKDLDVPTPQVMIEGKIVEANSSFSRTIGINWNFSGNQTQLSGSGGVGGSPVNLTPQLRIQNADSLALSGAPMTLNLDIGTLDLFGNLSAILALKELDNVAKVLSSPRIVTMNRQPASIQQSTENITLTSQTTGLVVTQLVNRTPVRLELQVTPQITSDSSVVMDVNVIREFLGASIGTTNAQPVNSRQAKTKIMVRSGQTAVIGGIYVNDNKVGDVGVPTLKDIPVLGWLFKSRTTENAKQELMIFLTPKILPSNQPVSTSS